MKFKIDIDGGDEGSVRIVPDYLAAANSRYAFIYDSEGIAVAWYGGCGSHELVITESFKKYLEGSSEVWGRETSLMDEQHVDGNQS